MQHPLTAMREVRGLNLSQMALALGLDYQRLHAMENGRVVTIGPTAARGLQRIGEDPRQIAADIAQWNRDQAEILIPSVKRA